MTTPFLARLARVTHNGAERARRFAEAVRIPVRRRATPATRAERTAALHRAAWSVRSRLSEARDALKARRVRRRVRLAGWLGRLGGGGAVARGKASRFAWRARVISPRRTTAARVWRIRSRMWRDSRHPLGDPWRAPGLAFYLATMREDVARARREAEAERAMRRRN